MPNTTNDHVDTSVGYTLPLVSIIVPTYNAQAYVEQCIESLLAQTYPDIELIIVDDGSTDSTPEILSEFAQRDERITVITQANAGPGVARNNGIDHARGSYLYFCDADDYVEPDLIETTVVRLEQTGADMAAFLSKRADARVEGSEKASWGIGRGHFPGEVVSWHDNPDYVFEAFTSYVWTKVYRTSLIRDNAIRFQEIYLTEDLLFASLALVCARSIVCIDKAFIFHREGTGESAMDTGRSMHAHDFIDAYCQLRRSLCDLGIFEELKVAYDNLIMAGGAYNLLAVPSYDQYVSLFNEFASDPTSAIGTHEVDAASLRTDESRLFAQALADGAPNEYLFAACRQFKRSFELRDLMYVTLAIENAERAIQADQLERDLNSTINSAEYKVGTIVGLVPRAAQRLILDARKNTAR